jgi:hypothetical protein
MEDEAVLCYELFHACVEDRMANDCFLKEWPKRNMDEKLGTEILISVRR